MRSSSLSTPTFLSRQLVLLALCLYALVLAVAAYNSVTSFNLGNAVCTTNGIQWIADVDKKDTKASQTKSNTNTNTTHLLKCVLCIPFTASFPQVLHDALPLHISLSYVLRAIPSAHLASLVSSPLPARGPPTFFF